MVGSDSALSNEMIVEMNPLEQDTESIEASQSERDINDGYSMCTTYMSLFKDVRKEIKVNPSKPLNNTNVTVGIMLLLKTSRINELFYFNIYKVVNLCLEFAILYTWHFIIRLLEVSSWEAF